MESRRAEARGVLGALALLAAVSLYRQLSLRFLPDDPVRPFAVFAVYLALLLFWGTSIRRRFTQRNTRLFLLGEVSVMLFWAAIRFVQEAAVPRNIALVRFLGYFILIPAVAVPLLGLYAAFGLGRGDEYRFSRRWYLLLPPAGALIALALTDELHHLLYRVVPGEPQPNLYFHPAWGIFIIYGWGLALIAGRTVVIYRRNRPVKDKSFLQRLAPFLEPLALLAFCAPYTASSFWVRREFVEFSAGVFFIEASSWELFIWLGLIPVNTQYKTVFDLSTVGMQIVTGDGRPLVRSRTAPELTPEVFAALLEKGVAAGENGQELRAYRLSSGCLVWQRDVSALRGVIRQLRKSAAELEQETGLLAQELKLRSEEAAVAEQNRIYDSLTAEVGPQLSLLRQLLAKRDAVPDREALFSRICLVGGYVKRRCNLRLIEQSDGAISGEDLALSLLDMTALLRDMGVDAELERRAGGPPSAAFALLSLDMLEFLLEYERFAPVSLRAVLDGGAFTVGVRSRIGAAPAAALERMSRDGCRVSCETAEGGYRAILTEGGAGPC